MSIYRRLLRWLGAEDRMTHIVPGNVTPGFSLKSIDGKEFSLSKALQRGPVVLAFFKVSCPVCKFTFPFLQRLYKLYGGDDVTFLGVSQDNADAARDFANEFGVTFPTLIDAAGYPVSNGYGLTQVPTFFLINQDATVQVVSIGFGKAEIEAIADRAALLSQNRMVGKLSRDRRYNQVFTGAIHVGDQVEGAFQLNRTLALKASAEQRAGAAPKVDCKVKHSSFRGTFAVPAAS
jgi:peroxiredoxin